MAMRTLAGVRFSPGYWTPAPGANQPARDKPPCPSILTKS